MKILDSVLNRDKLKSADQLIFIDYLRQALVNGYSLNASLSLLPKVWDEHSNQLKYVSKKVEAGVSLGDALHEIGFSSTLAAQIHMAVIGRPVPPRRMPRGECGRYRSPGQSAPV